MKQHFDPKESEIVMTKKEFYRDFYRDLNEDEQHVWDTADQFASEEILSIFGNEPTLEDVKDVLNLYI